MNRRGLVCCVPLRASYTLTGSSGLVKLVNQFYGKKVLIRADLKPMLAECLRSASRSAEFHRRRVLRV